MDQYQSAAEYLDSRYNSGLYKLPYSVTRVESYIDDFRKKYGPRELKKIEQGEALQKIMVLNNNYSMMHELAREDSSISGQIGHLGSYSANNFPFRVSKESSNYFIVGRGMPQQVGETIPFRLAEPYAYEYVNSLADICLEISADDLLSKDDYISLGERLEKQLGRQASHAWVHKYLYLLFPECFTNFHTADYKTKALRALGIVPDKTVFGTIWQWAEIRKHMELKDAYVMARVIYSDPKLMDVINSKKADNKPKSTTTSSKIVSVPQIDNLDIDVNAGVYDNWQIMNSNLAALDISFDEAGNDTYIIPEDAMAFFIPTGADWDEYYEIRVNSDESATIELDELGPAVFSLSEGLKELVEKTAEEFQAGLIALFERKGKGSYTLSFRPGKEKHIESVTEESVIISEEQDFKERLMEQEDSQLIREGYKYECKPEPRKEVDEEVKTGRVSYPRDPKKRVGALIRARYKCEYDESHPSFISKVTDQPYMETHHLIPIEYWQSFDNSLDVEANIVCLCSNCHNQIHYGRDAEIIIHKLYEQRKEDLKIAGIPISYNQLTGIYNGKYVSDDGATCD